MKFTLSDNWNLESLRKLCGENITTLGYVFGIYLLVFGIPGINRIINMQISGWVLFWIGITTRFLIAFDAPNMLTNVFVFLTFILLVVSFSDLLHWHQTSKGKEAEVKIIGSLKYLKDELKKV